MVINDIYRLDFCIFCFWYRNWSRNSGGNLCRFLRTFVKTLIILDSDLLLVFCGWLFGIGFLNNMNQKFDKQCLIDAYDYAKNSPDPSSKNAAILIKNERMVCMDYNRFPNGVALLPERLQRPLKYQIIEHAERNVIYSAAKLGIATEGLTMYCPWAACCDCARAIIQAGISRLVHHVTGAEHEYWNDSIKLAMEMLKEAGVEITTYTDKLGINNNLSILRNGQLIYP